MVVCIYDRSRWSELCQYKFDLPPSQRIATYPILLSVRVVARRELGGVELLLLAILWRVAARAAVVSALARHAHGAGRCTLLLRGGRRARRLHHGDEL